MSLQPKQFVKSRTHRIDAGASKSERRLAAAARAVMEPLECRRLLTATVTQTLFLPGEKSPPLTVPPSLADTTNDLLLNLQPLSTGSNATDYVPTFEGGPISNLTNGTTQNLVNGVPDGNNNDSSSMTNAVFDRDGDPAPTGLNPANTWQATYMLDLTSHRNGYNINELDSITGHQDNRTDQTIDVWALPVGADQTKPPGPSGGGWVDLATTQMDMTTLVPGNNFAYRPAMGDGSGQMKIVDADASGNPTGNPMAADIQGIMFIAVDPGAVFREFIVKGVPAAETAAPAAPPTLSANPGNQGVSLSWGAAPGAASYNVYRGTAPGGEGATPVATNITGTSYNDTGLTNGTTYYYVVKGVNPVGVGAASPEASASPHLAAPPAPTNLVAANQYQAVQLTWTAAPFATSYNVYRGTMAGGEAATPIATGVTGTSFNDTAVVGGTTYFYKVSAVNTAGEGAKSGEASIDALQGAEAHYYNQDWWIDTATVNALFDQAHTSINGVDINWSLGPPDGRITHLNAFSTLFNGKVIAPTTGMYTFVSNTQDDGLLYVNGQLVSEDLGKHGQRDAGATMGAGQTFPISLTAGQSYDFIFLQNKRTIIPATTLGGAAAHLEWITPDNTTGTPVIIPQADLIAQSSKPGKPTALTASTTTPDSVTLTWTDNSPSQIYYIIERSTDNFANPANTVMVGRTFIHGTSFTDTGLTPGASYEYRVRGMNFDASSDNSDTYSTGPLPARPAGGSISGSVAAATGDTNLTTTGTLDWAHWGDMDTNGNFVTERKAGAGGAVGLISDAGFAGVPSENLGGAPAAQNEVDQITPTPNTFTWIDGTPDASVATDPNGLQILGNPGDGFEITAPADTTQFRVLSVYVDETNAVGQLRARLSDGGDVNFVDSSVADPAGGMPVGAVYTITYKASKANQKLIVDWTMMTDIDHGTVSIEAASLAPGMAPTNVINDTTGGSTITLKQDADKTHIDWTIGAQNGQVGITDAGGLTINDSGAQDTIALDSSNGNPLPNLLKLSGKFAVNGFQSLGAGQKVDVESSTVQINYSGSSPLSTIQGYLKSGSIFSSTLASNAKFAIADDDSADPLNSGQPANTIVLRPAIIGNATLSGKVGFGDFVQLARNYGKSNADWAMGDFNYDGKVGFDDLVLLARNYNQSGPAATAALTPVISADARTLPKSRRPLSTRL